MKIPSPFKFFLLASFWISFATGLLWWVFNNWVRVPGGPLGDDHHPIEIWFTRVHSAFAYILLLALGYLVRVHIEPGLKKKKRRFTGISMITVFLILISTALPILYSPDGWLREFSTKAHTYFGFGIPFLLGLHLYWPKKAGL